MKLFAIALVLLAGCSKTADYVTLDARNWICSKQKQVRGHQLVRVGKVSYYTPITRTACVEWKRVDRD